MNTISSFFSWDELNIELSQALDMFCPWEIAQSLTLLWHSVPSITLSLISVHLSVGLWSFLKLQRLTLTSFLHFEIWFGILHTCLSKVFCQYLYQQRTQSHFGCSMARGEICPFFLTLTLWYYCVPAVTSHIMGWFHLSILTMHRRALQAWHVSCNGLEKVFIGWYMQLPS